ncbi:MAG TPA: DMT family transporter [Kofleriaceae bacterium]
MAPTCADPARAGRSTARAQLLAATVLSGLMAVLARLATLAGGGFSGGQNTVVRFAVGLACCAAYVAIRPGSFRPNRPGLLATRGLVGGTAVLLYFWALSRIPAGDATLLNSLFPLIATVMAIAVLRERPTARVALALAITAIGMAMVLGAGTRAAPLGLGHLAGFASAWLSATAMLSIRALRADHNAATIFAALCLGGLVAAAPFALQPWQHSVAAWALATASALAGVASHLLMTHSLGALTVPEAAVLQQLAPAASYLWAIPLLGETPRWPELLGVAAVTLGVALGAVRTARRP